MKLKLEPHEWDFSEIVSNRSDVRPALDWELRREWRRLGMYGRDLKSYFPLSVSEPWLALTRVEQRRLRRKDSASVSAVRAVPLGDVSRYLAAPQQRRFSRASRWFGVPPGFSPLYEGEVLHAVAVRWDEFKMSDIRQAFESLLSDLAKRHRSLQRVRHDDPVAGLWDLSCYRLRKHAGLSNAEVADRLNRLDAFRSRYGAFSADSVRNRVKSAERKWFGALAPAGGRKT